SSRPGVLPHPGRVEYRALSRVVEVEPPILWQGSNLQTSGHPAEAEDPGTYLFFSRLPEARQKGLGLGPPISLLVPVPASDRKLSSIRQALPVRLASQASAS